MPETKSPPPRAELYLRLSEDPAGLALRWITARGQSEEFAEFACQGEEYGVGDPVWWRGLPGLIVGLGKGYDVEVTTTDDIFTQHGVTAAELAPRKK